MRLEAKAFGFGLGKKIDTLFKDKTRKCSLIRSVIEYASAVFANLPKYLSDALEGIQKRTLRIILPNLHYDEARILSGLPSTILTPGTG